MNKFVIVLLYTLLSSVVYANKPIDSPNSFTEEEYAIALEKSKKENKLVFIDFHAKWCTPCKWMEKNTLTDPSIKKVLDEKYITVKVDIDDFDGFDLKEQYQVRTLPTIIFLNSDGKIIHRLNETIGTVKFLSLIENQSANIIPTVHPNNTSPFIKNETKVVINTSSLPTHTAPTHTAPTSYTPSKSHTSTKSHTSKVKYAPKTRKATKKKRTYKKYAAKKHGKRNVTLQIGIYNNLQEARKSMQNIQSKSNLPIEIMRESETQYKVLLGSFASREAASRYKKKLKKKYGILCLMK